MSPIKYHNLGPTKLLHDIVFAGSHDAGITQGADNVRTQSHNLFEQAAHGIRARSDAPGRQRGNTGSQFLAVGFVRFRLMAQVQAHELDQRRHCGGRGRNAEAGEGGEAGEGRLGVG